MSHSEVIIIKKKSRGGGHGGHHGGAWKVAYADFVTAMMAFFLLLWLLATTSQEQREGLADYFTPTVASKSSGGAGGMLGGLSLNSKGAKISDSAPLSMTLDMPLPEASDRTTSSDSPKERTGDAKNNPELLITVTDPKKKEASSKQQVQTADPIYKAEIDRQKQTFAKIKQEIERAVQANPKLAKFKDNLKIDQTDRGLRIQIVDRNKTSMFASGSAELYSYTSALLKTIANHITTLPNAIEIEGHTDAHPFTRGTNYSNWELSTQRANAARVALINNGVPPERIASVSGFADRNPLEKDNPLAATNRRVAVVLLDNSHR